MTFDLEPHGDLVRGYPALIIQGAVVCDADHPDDNRFPDPIAALIDTGCDFAVVPQEIIQFLELDRVDHVRATTRG